MYFWLVSDFRLIFQKDDACFLKYQKQAYPLLTIKKAILDFDWIFPLHKIFEIDWIHVYIQEYKSIKYIEHAFPFWFLVNTSKSKKS